MENDIEEENEAAADSSGGGGNDDGIKTPPPVDDGDGKGQKSKGKSKKGFGKGKGKHKGAKRSYDWGGHESVMVPAQPSHPPPGHGGHTLRVGGRADRATFPNRCHGKQRGSSKPRCCVRGAWLGSLTPPAATT